MVELARPQKNEIMADLGSGDGRILIAFAKMGVLAHGYELDKQLVKESQKMIRQEKLESKIIIDQKNFWDQDLSAFDIITIYPMPDIMGLLEAKLQKEVKPNSRVLLNYYPLPTIKPTDQKDSIYLYSAINATVLK